MQVGQNSSRTKLSQSLVTLSTKHELPSAALLKSVIRRRAYTSVKTLTHMRRHYDKSEEIDFESRSAIQKVITDNLEVYTSDESNAIQTALLALGVHNKLKSKKKVSWDGVG